MRFKVFVIAALLDAQAPIDNKLEAILPHGTAGIFNPHYSSTLVKAVKGPS
jgi:hypothetical protein